MCVCVCLYALCHVCQFVIDPVENIIKYSISKESHRYLPNIVTVALDYNVKTHGVLKEFGSEM